MREISRFGMKVLGNCRDSHNPRKEGGVWNSCKRLQGL